MILFVVAILAKMQARLHADVEKVSQSQQASSVMLSKTTTEQETEVYLLPLTDDGAPDVLGGYISLPPPTTPPYYVRFSIEGTSSICRDGSLWVNFASAGEQFGRENFKGFMWVMGDSSKFRTVTYPFVMPTDSIPTSAGTSRYLFPSRRLASSLSTRPTPLSRSSRKQLRHSQSKPRRRHTTSTSPRG